MVVWYGSMGLFFSHRYFSYGTFTKNLFCINSAMSRRYTDKEKIAYYKAKAAQAQQIPRAPRRASSAQPRTTTRKKTTYQYPGAGRKIGAALGGMAGSAISPGTGTAIGSAIGSVVGQGAHALVKRVTGFGDYNVGRNSLITGNDAVPEFSNSPRCTIITHREFIQDIKSGPIPVGSTASTAFDSVSFRINPGVSNTFPWLANIASNYEEYVIQGMIFEYKTTSAMAIGSTNTALGTVVLATQYNSLAQPFVNKQQMENYEFSQSTVPSQSIMHPIECDPNQTQSNGLFNVYNSGNSQDNDDIRLYDIGKFTIATVGMQTAGVVIGELWVTYKICFMKPRLTGVSNVADNWSLVPANISNLNRLVGATQSPSSSGFTAVWDQDSRYMTIDPSFSGLLGVCLNIQGCVTGDFLTQTSIQLAGNIEYADATYTSNGALFPNVKVTVDSTGQGIQKFYLFKVSGGYGLLDIGGTNYTVPPMLNIGGPSSSQFFITSAVAVNLYVFSVAPSLIN